MLHLITDEKKPHPELVALAQRCHIDVFEDMRLSVFNEALQSKWGKIDLESPEHKRAPYQDEVLYMHRLGILDPVSAPTSLHHPYDFTWIFGGAYCDPAPCLDYLLDEYENKGVLVRNINVLPLFGETPERLKELVSTSASALPGRWNVQVVDHKPHVSLDAVKSFQAWLACNGAIKGDCLLVARQPFITCYELTVKRLLRGFNFTVVSGGPTLDPYHTPFGVFCSALAQQFNEEVMRLN